MNSLGPELSFFLFVMEKDNQTEKNPKSGVIVIIAHFRFQVLNRAGKWSCKTLNSAKPHFAYC